MNILWITNIQIGDVVDLSKKPMGGLWMDALLAHIKGNSSYKLTVVTTGDVEDVECTEINSIRYYLLPGGIPVYYKRPEKPAKSEWRKIFDDEKPDVIHVWGTEYSHALYGLEVAKEYNIPSVVYIQGIMMAIARYATGNLPFKTMVRYITLRDIYRSQILFRQKKWFLKRAETENKLLSLSGSIVVENKWAEAMCKAINSNLNVYHIPLNINKAFFERSWNYENVIPHTIICNASGPAYKGLHVLLNALILIKRRYPDVKLLVPGGSLMVNTFKERQRTSGYRSLITDFIKHNHLEDNVQFIGYQTQENLAEYLSKSHVFVLPSAIENHSSSLKEAMAVGIPSVAALVGGIPEYFEFGKTGYSYRYDDYECIADYVCSLFEDPQTCKSFSIESRRKIRECKEEDIYQMVLDMYEDCSYRH